MNTHPLAGKTVILKINDPSSDMDKLDGRLYRVEDWSINVIGISWMDTKGNPAAIKYAMRAGSSNLPTDDKVVYGKVGMFGHLIHESELGEVVRERQ